MKNLSIILFLFAGITTGRLLAQGHESANSEKMKPFASWVGQWHGEGIVQMGGEMKTSKIAETVQSKLNGNILVIEGLGTSIDEYTNKEVVVHHAFGVLSYDQASGEYKFRAYLNDGRSTDAWFKVIEENTFQWGFESTRGHVRYTMHVNGATKRWEETGEYSQDGKTWRKFFEMDLAKAG